MNISFKDLAETIWDVNGFEGTVLDIVSHLPQNEEEFIGCFIGKMKKIFMKNTKNDQKSLS